MADAAKLRAAIAEKTSLSTRQITRLITDQEKKLLTTRDMATIAVAFEKGVVLRRFVSAQELAEFRALRDGASRPASAPSATPAAQKPARPAPGRAKPLSKPAPAPKSKPPAAARANTVMVIYGRNDRIQQDLFQFLRAIGLFPLEWNTGIAATNTASPTVAQIVDALFAKAAGAVVLLTPDDEVRLRPAFRKANDHPYEKELSGQARPNVTFEAGMAAVHHPASTVFVQVGPVKPFTDIGGVHITHLSNTTTSRQELATKLAGAGLAVDMTGTQWHTIGNFALTEEELRGGDD